MKKSILLNFETRALLLLVFGMILLSTFLSSAVYAILPATPYVKITSPHKGQQVPVGNILVSGTSSDNANTNCRVLIQLNHIKPSQQTTPTGHGGANDYSTWTFTSTPKYAVIKEGQNKISAKLSCPENLNFTKSSSINVTGVAVGQQSSTTANTTTSNGNTPPQLPLPLAGLTTSSNSTAGSTSGNGIHQNKSSVSHH